MTDSKRGLAKLADANPTNQQDLLAASITRLRGALVFWQPHDDPSTMLHCSTQIVQAFTTDTAAACVQDAHGSVRFLLRNRWCANPQAWSLATAAQLIRNHACPHRWVAVQAHPETLRLFWQSGGLQRCRERLACTSQLNAPRLPFLRRAIQTNVNDWD